MQKITLIGRPVAMSQLRAGSVFAIPRRGGSTFGLRAAGADFDDAVTWVCLADPDPERRFRVVRTPAGTADPVFVFPAAGTSIDPQSLLPMEAPRPKPGMIAMTDTNLILAIRGEENDALLVDLESGALPTRVAEPAVFASRWQLVVLGHGDQPSPLFSVDVTPN